jgi:hypothetical protein
MLRKVGCLIVALGLAVPVWAAARPGSISGYVRSTAGAPQMGAMVEILGSAVPALRAFTDGSGYYSIGNLLPGVYNLKVSAPFFLPATRSRVGLRNGGAVVVNVTLATLVNALQSVPWKGAEDDDDWKWVLRSSANRPILRLANSPSSPSHGKPSQNDALDFTGSLSFVAGSQSEGFGSSDMITGFSVEKSLFSSGTLAVRGNVGYGEGLPGGVVRASYTHRLENGSDPQVSLTLRSLPSPMVGMQNASLQALALTTSDSFVLGDVLELKFGSELQTIQFMGRVTAFRPFGSVRAHLSPNTVVAYSYASSEPDNRLEKGFDTAPADLSESQPRMSIAGSSPALERAHHHEVSLSQHSGKDNLQVAFYADRVDNPALTGVGEFTSDGGEVLPDAYSGTFTYQGQNLNTHGVRFVWQHQLTGNVATTIDYGYGGVLELGTANVNLQDARQAMRVRDRQTVAAKLSGTVGGSKTHWVTSYRWTGGNALTDVDMFDNSPGQADPYLSIFLRQPIPGTGFLPGRMDAVIDIRNLLAQGYVPVAGQDGHTVYLVQAARAVRGGLAFTF